MAPMGPPAKAPMTIPVATPMFSCFDAGARCCSAACTGRDAAQAAARVSPSVRARTWVMMLMVKSSWLVFASGTTRSGLLTVQLERRCRLWRDCGRALTGCGELWLRHGRPAGIGQYNPRADRARQDGAP